MSNTEGLNLKDPIVLWGWLQAPREPEPLLPVDFTSLPVIDWCLAPAWLWADDNPNQFRHDRSTWTTYTQNHFSGFSHMNLYEPLPRATFTMGEIQEIESRLWAEKRTQEAKFQVFLIVVLCIAGVIGVIAGLAYPMRRRR